MKVIKRAAKLLAITITVILAFAMLSSCANVSGSSAADSRTVSPAASNTAEQSSPIPSETNGTNPSETNLAPPDADVTHENSTAPTLSVLFINVGKADSALITYGNQHYLIDTGSADSLPILIRTLDTLNVSSLDGIFITHPHKDHIGGLSGLLSLLDVRKIYMPKITDYEQDGSNKVADIAEQFDKQLVLLSAGDTLPFSSNDVVFSVVGPVVYNDDEENNNSLVMYLSYGDTHFLFTGDMQFGEEASILSSLFPCDVLKVAHHGNKDATSTIFAQTVLPKIAVISTDKDNLDNKATKALEDVGAQILITSESEMGILITSDGQTLLLESLNF